MNMRAALVVGANRYSRNNNSAHLRSSVCCRSNGPLKPAARC